LGNPLMQVKATQGRGTMPSKVLLLLLYSTLLRWRCSHQKRRETGSFCSKNVAKCSSNTCFLYISLRILMVMSRVNA